MSDANASPPQPQSQSASAPDDSEQQLRSERASHARTKRALEIKERELVAAKARELQLQKDLAAAKADNVPEPPLVISKRTSHIQLPTVNHRNPHEVCRHMCNVGRALLLCARIRRLSCFDGGSLRKSSAARH